MLMSWADEKVCRMKPSLSMIWVFQFMELFFRDWNHEASDIGRCRILLAIPMNQKRTSSPITLGFLYEN